MIIIGQLMPPSIQFILVDMLKEWIRFGNACMEFVLYIKYPDIAATLNV